MAKSKSTKAQQASAFDGLDQDEQEQLAIIKASLQTIVHYFGRMAKLFGAVNDPRVPYLITYPLEALAFAGVLMYLCRLGARRQIALMFRRNGVGLSLIFTGIARIIVGGVAKQISKGYRVINIAIGVISIIGGIFAIANPITAIATLIWIVSIFILIHGLGLIASGIVSKGVDKGSRVSGIVLGGIAVAFASILLAYPGLALVMMIIFLSLGLLFNGIASVVSGITGNRIMQPLAK